MSGDPADREPPARSAFLHIPKTGGTALRQHMAQGGRDVMEIDEDLLYHLRDHLRDCRLIVGHIPFYAFGLEPAGRRIFSVIREPRARVISFFNHILSEPHHHGHRLLAGGAADWLEAFELRPFVFETCNLQTRMLGVRPDRSLLIKAGAGDLHAYFACRAHYLGSRIGDAELQAAIAAMRNDMTVAVYDILAFCISLGFAGVGGRLTGALPRVRVPTRRLDLSERLIDRIDAENQYDRLLYEAAHEIALARAADLVAARVELLDLEGGPMDFVGLHEVEPYRGETLRWTDGHATLPILLPERTTGCRIEVEVWPLPHIDAERIEVSVGGVRASRVSGAETSLRWQLHCAPGQKRSLRALDLRIDSDTRSFHGDPRTLGVALRSVQIHT